MLYYTKKVLDYLQDTGPFTCAYVVAVFIDIEYDNILLIY